jgi:hypothetical protein
MFFNSLPYYWEVTDGDYILVQKRSEENNETLDAKW